MLRAHPGLLIAVFCSELTPECFRRLARVFKPLGGAAAQNPFDRVHTSQVARDLVYEAMQMLGSQVPQRDEFTCRI